MSAILKMMCRVIQRRLDTGEKLEDILLDYPKLSEEEILQIKSYLEG